MRLFLAVICGTASGLSLGITGIGSVLALPLFVYILGLAPHPAVCASMIAVGTTALYGCISRWRTAQIDLKSGLVVATAGILAAPFGAWMSNYILAKPLLLLFGFVVAVVAIRLLIKGLAPRHNAVRENRDERGKSKRASVGFQALAIIVFLSGILAGLLGIGGGFVIVPALILYAEVEARDAVSTALFAVGLISISAVAAHLFAGQRIPWNITLFFALGGLGGISIGSSVTAHVSRSRLEQVFALAILAMAVVIIVRNLHIDASATQVKPKSVQLFLETARLERIG